ncbi:hypothetical protein BH11PLA2_BH11PLA2_04590 [soil metagenome]
MSRPISRRSPWLVPLACGISVWIAGAVAAVYLLDRDSAAVPVAKVIPEPLLVVEPPKPIEAVEIAKAVPAVVETVKPVAKPAEPLATTKPAPTADTEAETIKPAMLMRDNLPKDSHGYVTYSVPQRLDSKTSVELERQLLGVTELALDPLPNPNAPRSPVGVNIVGTTAHTLVTLANKSTNTRTLYAGPVMLSKSRPDLAGIPFRVGTGTLLPRDRAEAMNVLSRQLRVIVQSSSQGRDDSRPDVDRLKNEMTTPQPLSGKDRTFVSWSRDEAVPCFQQMLQAESQPIRRMSCELLKDIDGAEATTALVQWAVFDTDAGNRAAAIEALRGRERKGVSSRLASYLNYPWPAAVEHACEALVALGCTEAIPQLQAAESQPDPDAPFAVDLPDNTGGTFRRSMTRVNHARNCLLCHPPSFKTDDLIRGAIPSLTQSLPSPISPSYYNGSGGAIPFVTADTTYLKQDFSVVQPVTDPGPWPKYQRFDYFVTIRRDKESPVRTARADSPYRKAITFALLKLNADEVTAPRKSEASEVNVAEAARFVSFLSNPMTLGALKSSKLGLQFDAMTPQEIEQTVLQLQRSQGHQTVRLALIANFDELARTGPEELRVLATQMLIVARNKSISNFDLPGKLAKATKPPAPTLPATER